MSTQAFTSTPQSPRPQSPRTPDPIASSSYAAAPPPDQLIGRNPKSVSLPFADGIILGDPSGPDPTNPQFVPNHVTVCSVFPATLATPQRAFRCAGFPQFIFPTPPKDGFTCHRVYDSVAIIADPSKLDNRDWDGADMQVIRPVRALDPSGNGGLAFDIVELLAGGMLGTNPQRRMGLGIIRGDLPTETEFNHLRAIQDAFFSFYVNLGDDLDRSEKRGEIGLLHRFALEQTGDFSPDRHPWYKEVRRQAMKSCFACGKLIAAASTVCSECGQDLILLALNRYRSLGDPMVTLAMDPVVFPLVEKAIARVQAVQAPVSAATTGKRAPAEG